MAPKAPAILIIVGITGDLAIRKLLPAIEALAKAAVLPADFKIIGTSRRPDVTIDDVLLRAEDSAFVREHLEFFQMDVNAPSAYENLSKRLGEVEREFGASAQRLFYLAVPPLASRTIIEMLGSSGLAAIEETKLLLEKPFGVDLASANDIIEHIDRHFKPEQVYRIDHYLAKGMAQKLIAERVARAAEPIERVEIRAIEKIGVERRVDFYEQTGALRDFLQSHLLELVALACMGGAETTQGIPERRLAALKRMSILPEELRPPYVKRGQYAGYRIEVGNPESMTETYISLTLRIGDIHIVLTTGKNFSAKVTDIHVVYAKDETHITDSAEPATAAYERVFTAALAGNRELFVSSAEILECWRILAPAQEALRKNDIPLILYKPGSDPATIG